MSEKKTMHFGPYTVEISRPDKVLFDNCGVTKADLANYYRQVAQTMLPHLAGRPVMMERWPDGIGGEKFYQKDIPDYFPSWIDRVTVEKEDGTVEHLICDNAATLVYLAAQACISPHTWLSRQDRQHHPDRLVIDLDPPGEDFTPVRRIALVLRETFEKLGLVPFVMTTGSRGLHVVVPLDRSSDFDAVREFAATVADRLAKRRPDQVTTARLREKRGERIFLDVGRNAYAQTSIAPYAVRARPGAPVATPLDWEEVENCDLGPRKYTVANLFRRLGQKDDPWRGIDRHARALGSALDKLGKSTQDD